MYAIIIAGGSGTRLWPKSREASPKQLHSLITGKSMVQETIARIKKINDKKKFLQELKKIKIPEINFVVKKFNLKKSVLTPDGPVYEDLEVCELE